MNLRDAMLLHRYEPFVDLSLPLIKEGKSGKGLSWFKSNNISILDCLHAFTAEELMQVTSASQCLLNDNMKMCTSLGLYPAYGIPKGLICIV